MTIASRVLRRVAVRTVGGLIRRRGWILVLVLLVAGGIAVTTLDLVPLPSTLTMSASSSTAPGYEGGALGEPEATASFIKGNQVYDANLIWSTFSDQLKVAYQRGGGSVADTQAQLEQAKRSGSHLESAQYIGGYLIPNGSMHFYAVQNSGPSGRVDYSFYVFRLDKLGKIVKIE
jgi:hypothetical protein